MSEKLTRRDVLKLTGAALGGLAVGETTARAAWNDLEPPPGLTEVNTRFNQLKPFHPGEALGAKEMRISFMGTSVIERRAQARSSIFVELGNGESFVFDCGSGVVSNYVAMNVPWSRMRKIFLTHLHGDHTSDLTHIYCFGPQGDAKSPLYIFGPSASGVRNPDFEKNPRNQIYNPKYYDDGTVKFAQSFREMNRWHTESQSFVSTQWNGAEGDGYDIYATQLHWRNGNTARRWTTNSSLKASPPAFVSSDPWVAYATSDVRISFFPAIHGRNGSLGYKLEWFTGDGESLSMIFTGDTKPNRKLIETATAGSAVDVLISEVVVDPEIWVSRQTGISDPTDPKFESGMVNAEAVQENSHTPEKALGYMLGEMAKRGKAPRLAVGTHFQATDDTMALAFESIRSLYSGPVTIVTDLEVLNVTKDDITQRRAVVSDYSWSANWTDPRQLNGGQTPKYADTRECNPYRPSAPLAQFAPELLEDVIDPCEYDPTGWQCTNRGSCGS